MSADVPRVPSLIHLPLHLRRYGRILFCERQLTKADF